MKKGNPALTRSDCNMEKLSLVKSLIAMAGKGNRDTELSDELTNAYFGNAESWTEENLPEPSRKNQEDLATGAD
jgi:hypothetical protein